METLKKDCNSLHFVGEFKRNAFLFSFKDFCLVLSIQLIHQTTVFFVC